MIISLRRKYMTVNYALPSSATITTLCLVLSAGYITAASLIACPKRFVLFSKLYSQICSHASLPYHFGPSTYFVFHES